MQIILIPNCELVITGIQAAIPQHCCSRKGEKTPPKPFSKILMCERQCTNSENGNEKQTTGHPPSLAGLRSIPNTVIDVYPQHQPKETEDGSTLRCLTLTPATGEKLSQVSHNQLSSYLKLHSISHLKKQTLKPQVAMTKLVAALQTENDMYQHNPESSKKYTSI